MNAHATHRAISAYNKADYALWEAHERQVQAKDHLIALLAAYPVTTDDLAIRHHIICTEQRELTDEDRRFFGMEDDI